MNGPTEPRSPSQPPGAGGAPFSSPGIPSTIPATIRQVEGMVVMELSAPALQLQLGHGSASPAAPAWRNSGRAAQRRLSFEAEDILATGAVLAAILTIIFIAAGRIPAPEGSRIVLGCVGGSAIAVVIRAVRRGRDPRPPSSRLPTMTPLD